MAVCLAAYGTGLGTGLFGGSRALAADDKVFPLSYYLTNAGYVTPVKLQSPWGDCWSFAVASAIESSILKETADLEAQAAEEAAAAAAAAEAEAEARESSSGAGSGGAGSAGADDNAGAGSGSDSSKPGKKKRGGEPMSSSASEVGVPTPLSSASAEAGASTGAGSDAAADASSSAAAANEGTASASTSGSASTDSSTSASAGAPTSSSTSASTAASATSLATAVDMSQPKLLALNNAIDISERAIAWLAHELQSEQSAGSQAGEGFYLVDPENSMNQLAEGNFEMIGSQLIARQSLVSEEAAPYRYNNYSGSPIWYSTGSRDGAWDDARTKDWSIDESMRTNTDLGWVVSGIRRLPDPAILELDYTTALSTYIGYDADATQDIKNALVEIGAVAIALEADISLPSEVSSGNLSDAGPSEHFTYSTWSQYNGSDTIGYNHAVTIVGWDDNYSADNFAGTASGKPIGNGAWLCKNNWGSDALYSTEGNAGDATHWGIPASSETGMATTAGADGSESSGFFWLSYYDHSIHSPMAFEVTPIDEDFENIYQYDYLGSAEYSKPAIYEGDVWTANLYEAKELELVEAVSAQTFKEDDSVNIVVYTLPNRLTTEEMSADELFAAASSVSHQSVTFEHAGFHTIELKEPILLSKGQRFIVAEQVTTTNTHDDGTLYDGSYLNLEMSYLDAAAAGSPSTMSKVVANPGETFVSLPDGSWMSVEEYSELYADTSGAGAEDAGIAFGNALAKAFTSTTSMSKIGQVYESVRLK